MATKEKQAVSLPQEPQDAPVKKPSRVKRVVIIVAILVMMLGGIGIGGYWWFFLRTPSEASAPAAEAQATEQPAARQSGAQPSPAGAPGAAGTAGTATPGAPRIERPNDLPRSAGLVLPLPPVTVNLSDASGRRYLKLGMEVEVNADVSDALKTNSARIRDAVIMLLAGKTYTDISSPDGKVLLKAEVAARLNQILGAQRVIRVYFTDFVVE